MYTWLYGPRWFLKLIFIIRTFTAGNSFRLSDERAAGYSRNPKPETPTSNRWALCFQFEWLLCSFATIERCKSFRASRLNIMEGSMAGGGRILAKRMVVTHRQNGMHIKVTAHSSLFSIFNGHFINFEHVFNMMSGVRFTNYVEVR